MSFLFSTSNSIHCQSVTFLVVVISCRIATLEEVLANITDVRTLKQKRSARKGKLKRQSNHHRSIKDVPLDRQRLPDLKRRLEAVLAAYDLIQEDRVEEVDDDESTAKEEAEVMDQQCSNNDLVEAYQVLIDAAQARTSGERLQDEAQDLQKSADMASNYARQSYERLVADYKEVRQSIKKMLDYEELGRLQEDLDPIIHDLSIRIIKELVIVATTDGSASSQHSDDPIEPSQPIHSKLKLQLPHFTVDLLHWKDFWDLFGAVIEGERLSDHEKICHLQASRMPKLWCAMPQPKAPTMTWSLPLRRDMTNRVLSTCTMSLL